ncbi:MAG TPA: sulfatase [Acidimicrobiales bacterium]|nr:sulfatase [Acidimicrobiales bacterium]
MVALLAAGAAALPSPSTSASTRAAAVPVPVPVTWAQRHGIATGPASALQSQTATRSQGATWLWRQAARPEPVAAPPADARAGTITAQAAAWLIDEGVVRQGLPFRGSEPLLRSAFVTWLWRLADRPPPDGDPGNPDVRPTAAYADAVAWAGEEGIIAPSARFRPNDGLRRVDALTWLWRQAGRPDGSETNVLFILTDDQDAASLAHTPRTEALIGGDQGTTFAHAISSFPWCCPSRASLYSGQYSHNHRVFANRPPLGGYPVFDHDTALPTWFEAAGYETAFVGKYLNFYDGPGSDPPIPPGWDHWWAALGQVRGGTGIYFDYAAYDDGEVVVYGNSDEDYVTDVIAERSEQDLRRLWAGGRPFFLHVGHIAPHAGFHTPPEGEEWGLEPTQDNFFSAAPARRHHNTSTDPLPQPPSYGEEDLSDKPPWLRVLGEAQWDQITPQEQTDAYQSAVESLAAVDESVEALVAQLESLGALEDTLIVFMSDNGYLWGEHRVFGKQVPYDESLRIPLVVRGPGFPAGEVVETPVMNVDIAPTLAQAAGLAPTLTMDGIALQEVAADDDAWRDRAVLYENWPSGSRDRPGPVVFNHFEGVRTWRYSYAESDDGGIELYDHVVDPYELTSFHDDPRYAAVRDALAEVLHGMVGCVGEELCTTRADIPDPAP